MHENLKEILPQDVIELAKGIGITAEAMTETDDLVNLLGLATGLAERSSLLADSVATIALEKEAVFFANAFTGRASLASVAKRLGFAGSNSGNRAAYTLLALQASTFPAADERKVPYSTFLHRFARNQGKGIAYGPIKEGMNLPKGTAGALTTQTAVLAALDSAYNAKVKEALDAKALVKKAEAAAEYEAKVKKAEAEGKAKPKPPAILREKEQVSNNDALLRRMANAAEGLTLDGGGNVKTIIQIVATLEALKEAIQKAAEAKAPEAPEAPITTVPDEDNVLV